MPFKKSYYNNEGHPVPRVTVGELSSSDIATPCDTPPGSHPWASHLSPQNTGDDNDVDDGVSLTSVGDSVRASADRLGHVFNRDYEVGASGEIRAVGSDMSLLPIEVELIEAERARDRDTAYARALSEASEAGLSNGNGAGAHLNYRRTHHIRRAWHELSLATTCTSDSSIPDWNACTDSQTNSIIGPVAPAASEIPRRSRAAPMNTNNTANSSLGCFAITQQVLGSKDGNVHRQHSSDWSADSIPTINGPAPNQPLYYVDGPFPFHTRQPFHAAEEAAAQDLSVWELEKQIQVNARRDPLESPPCLEFLPETMSVVGTASPGRVIVPYVITINTISAPASVYNGAPKNAFMIDNSGADEDLRNGGALTGVSGYDSPGTNRGRSRGLSRQRCDLSTHHSFSSLSHFTHLNVDAFLKAKVCCLVILCIFLALSGIVLWLVVIKRMHTAAGIFCLFFLGAAILKLGSESIRAFGLRNGEVSDLERIIRVRQKNVASLI